MLYTAFQLDTPAAVRYPRGSRPGCARADQMQASAVGKGELRRQGKPCRHPRLRQHAQARAGGRRGAGRHGGQHALRETAGRDLVSSWRASHELLVTVEENVVQGGAGSAVAEYLAAQG